MIIERPDLSDEEVDALCQGITQNAAKLRFLRRLGLRVDQRPNGRPLVWRAALLAATGAAAAPASPSDNSAGGQPDVTGMQAWLASRGNRSTHGKTTQRR